MGLPSRLCTLHIFHVVQAELHHLVPSAPDRTQAQAAPQTCRLHQLHSLCMQYCALDCHVPWIARQAYVKAVLQSKHAKLYVILSGNLV